MFDMGFTEVVLIGVVALVVIGPERLPAVAVTVGKYVGRLKRFMTNVRADVESELKTDEIRKLLAAQQEELSSLKDVVSEASKGLDMSGVAKSIDESMSSILEKSEVPTEQVPTEQVTTLEQSSTEPETSPVENAVAESASTDDSSVVEPKKKKGSAS
jgi:sec-independent protein translocase protein TatB